MALLVPTCALRRVTDVTPGLLQRMRVRALLLDVDNTLAFPDSQTPLPGTVEWARALRNEGFTLVIVSNNSEKRVRPFAARYGIPYCARSGKPLPAAYFHAARLVGADRRETAVVGDQVFTDILGANLAGMRSVLLFPVREEPSLSFRIRRMLERPVRAKIEKKSNGG